VLEALTALRERGATVAIATNKPGVFARPLVDALFPAGMFAAVLGPDDAGAHKPDPALLRAIDGGAAFTAARRSRVRAYVGDSPVDAETAKAAGVPFVGVAWGLRSTELAALGATVVQRPSDLVEALTPLL